MSGLVQKPVVLFCAGSFNPITNKHLRMMELARDALHRTGKYKVLKGIFSPVNDAYVKDGQLPASRRYDMIRLAVKSNPWLCVDRWEMEQTTWTPTQIALARLKDRIASGSLSIVGDEVKYVGDEPQLKRTRKSNDAETLVDELPSDTQVKLLCGGDLLDSFEVPDLWTKEHMESIARDFGLAVIVREGSDPHLQIYHNDQLIKYIHNIDIIYDRIGDDSLSSTKIRRALKRNESVKYLIEDAVLGYIIKHKLYNPNYKVGEVFPTT